MRFNFLLVIIILISSCRNEIKETISLLDFVPQNSIGVIQINDPLMLDNALKKLSFLVELSKLDSKIYENIKAVVPEKKGINSILILTPQGKGILPSHMSIKLTNQILLNLILQKILFTTQYQSILVI